MVIRALHNYGVERLRRLHMHTIPLEARRGHGIPAMAAWNFFAHSVAWASFAPPTQAESFAQRSILH